MKAKLFSGITLLALFGVVSSANSQEGFLYSGGSYTLNLLNQPDGINDLGQILIGQPLGGIFLYSSGVYTALNLSPPGSTGGVSVSGINNAGDITGTFRNGNGTFSGFLY